MEILCLSAETNLTIITIAVSVIAVLIAILISYGVWLRMSGYKTLIRKDYEKLENIILDIYNNRIPKLDKDKPFKRKFNNIDDLNNFLTK